MKFEVQKFNYKTIPQYFLRDKRLSLKAKGLLATMYGLPNEWDYSMSGLCTICNVGETQMKGALKELKICGYIEVRKERDYLGRYEYKYFVYAKAQKKLVDKSIFAEP